MSESPFTGPGPRRFWSSTYSAISRQSDSTFARLTKYNNDWPPNFLCPDSLGGFRQYEHNQAGLLLPEPISPYRLLRYSYGKYPDANRHWGD